VTTAFRIIPRLDIKGPNLVKGIHLEGLRVLGKPEDFAKYYYENGADELIYQDIVASLYGRNSLHEIISRTAQDIFSVPELIKFVLILLLLVILVLLVEPQRSLVLQLL